MPGKKKHFKLILWTILVWLIAIPEGYAFIWQGLQSPFRGAPVALFQVKEELWVLTDDGLNRDGHMYTGWAYQAPYWKQTFHVLTDSAGMISTVQVFGDDIYLAGRFDRLAGVEKSLNIVRFNLKTKKIHPLIQNEQNAVKFRAVHQMVVYNNKLFIGGTFAAIDNISANNILAYDGNWVRTALNDGSGLNGPVSSLLTDSNSLLISGLFNRVNGEASPFFTIWTGDAWKFFPKNEIKPQKGVRFGNSYLYTGFNNGNKAGFYLLGSEGFEKEEDGIGDVIVVQDLIRFQDAVYACGLFKLEGSEDYETIIKYEQGKWTAIPGGNQLVAVKGFTVFKNVLVTYGGFNLEKFNINKIALYKKEYAFLSGSVFFDKNENCIQDNRDEVLSDVLLEINPGRFFTKPDVRGNYRIFLPAGTYTVRISDKRNYWIHSSCSSSEINVSLKPGEIRDSVNFARKYISNIEDVQVVLSASGGWQARNGKRYNYMIRFENLGSEKIGEGSVELHFNPRLAAGALAPLAPERTTDSSFTWKYQNLNPGEVRYIPVYFLIPQTIDESEIRFEAAISQSANETAISDNQSGLTQNIGPEDFVNGKQVFPSPEQGQSVAYMDPDREDELIYSINFANFSTDTMHTVRVIDTIDVDLDLSYIQELGASHPYETEVLNGPPGSNYAVVVWTFNNIQLLPNPAQELDKIGYQGFISFKLKLHSGLSYGTEISNRATIVFNDQVSNFTNEVITLLEKTSGIEETKRQDGLKVYPNPARNLICVQYPLGTSGICTVEILDLLGKSLLQKQGDAMDERMWIHLDTLPAGTYLLSLQTEGTRSVHRILLTR